MKVIPKPQPLTATQRHAIGDHPEVIKMHFSSALNPNEVNGIVPHHKAQSQYLEDWVVHPGDWVLEQPTGRLTVVSDHRFKTEFLPYEEEDMSSFIAKV
jgi:hypothetical protein